MLLIVLSTDTETVTVGFKEDSMIVPEESSGGVLCVQICPPTTQQSMSNGSQTGGQSGFILFATSSGSATGITHSLGFNYSGSLWGKHRCPLQRGCPTLEVKYYRAQLAWDRKCPS